MLYFKAIYGAKITAKRKKVLGDLSEDTCFRPRCGIEVKHSPILHLEAREEALINYTQSRPKPVCAQIALALC